MSKQTLCRSCGWAIHLDFGLWTDATGQSVCGFEGNDPIGHTPASWNTAVAVA